VHGGVERRRERKCWKGTCVLECGIKEKKKTNLRINARASIAILPTEMEEVAGKLKRGGDLLNQRSAGRRKKEEEMSSHRFKADGRAYTLGMKAGRKGKKGGGGAAVRATKGAKKGGPTEKCAIPHLVGTWKRGGRHSGRLCAKGARQRFKTRSQCKGGRGTG